MDHPEGRTSTGTMVAIFSRCAQSFGLRVYRGSRADTAVAAMRRSAILPTEVSTIPRACRRSVTRARILVDQGIEVPSQTASSEPRSAGESRHGGAGGHETPASRRYQLSNCYAVPGDEEALAAVERAHHFPAVVAQLTLGDLARHGDSS